MPIETTEYIQDPKQDVALKNAQTIGDTLSIPDVPQKIEEVFQLIRKPLEKPEKSLIKSENVQKDLYFKYIELIDLQKNANDAMRASAGFAKNKVVLQAGDRSNILRHMAKYVEARQIYDALLRGKSTKDLPFPPWLAEFVKPDKENEMMLTATKVILPMQYDVQEEVGLSETPPNLAFTANEILILGVNRKVSMKHILACVQNGKSVTDAGPYINLLEVTGFHSTGKSPEPSRKNIDAAKFAAGYLIKYLPEIEAAAQLEGKTVEQLTIDDALECALGSHPLAEMSKKIIANASNIGLTSVPDLREIAKEALENKDLYPAKMVQVALAPLAKLQKGKGKNLEQFKADAEKVTAFFMSFEAANATASRVNLYTQHMSDPQKELVQAVCDSMKDPKQLEQMRQALFIPKDQKDWGKLDKQAAKAIDDIIASGELSPKEAFQLYYLANTGKGIGIPLSYTLINVLNDHGQGTLSFDLQFRAVETVGKLALMEASDIPGALSKLGFSEKQMKEFRNMIYFMEASGMAHGMSILMKLNSLIVNHFDIIGPALGITILAGGTIVWRKLELAKMRKFAYMGAQEARGKFPKIPASPTVTDEMLNTIQMEIRDILAEREGIPKWRMLYKEGLRSEAKGLFKASRKGLDDLAKTLHNQYGNPEDVASRLRKAGAETKDVHAALAKLKYYGPEVKKFEDAAIALSKRFETFEKTTNWPTPTAREAARTKLAADAVAFQKSLNTFTDVHGDEARRAVIKRLYPDMKPDGIEAVINAHNNASTQPAKSAIMEPKIGTERSSRLQRIGVAGKEPIGAITKTGAKINTIRSPRLSGAPEIRLPRGLPWNKLTYALPIADVALGGYFMRKDIDDLAESFADPERVRTNLRETLKPLGFSYHAENKDGKIHEWYERGPVRLDVDADVLAQLSNKESAAWKRIAVDAAELGSAGSLGMATMLLGESGVALSPVGILIGLGALSTHVYLNESERGEAYKFIEDAPPWLVGIMGTEATIGQSEHELLMSGIWTDVPPEAKKKMFLALFIEQLKKDPALIQEITGNNLSPELIDEFYKNDFEKFILPSLSAFMFANAKPDIDEHTSIGDRITWEKMRNLTLQRQRLEVPLVGQEVIESSLRKSAVLYVNHLREKRYLDGRKEVANALFQEKDLNRAEELDRIVTAYGMKKVFGHSLLVTDHELKLNEGKQLADGRIQKGQEPLTRAQILLQRTLQKLDTLPKKDGETTYESLRPKVIGPDKKPVPPARYTDSDPFYVDKPGNPDNNNWWLGTRGLPQGGFQLEEAAESLSKDEQAELELPLIGTILDQIDPGEEFRRPLIRARNRNN